MLNALSEPIATYSNCQQRSTLVFSQIKKIFSNRKTKNKSSYFIHIPKTAGTSFINILDATVNENEIFPCQLWQDISQDLISHISEYKLLRGHFGGGSYKLLAPDNPHKLTILRHPQALSVSTFHFIKREKNTAVHDLVNDKKMDLKNFLEEPLTAHKINNRMVRHLSFDLQQDPEAQELFLSKQSINVVSGWIRAPKKINNAKRLIRAKKLLDSCSWFGIQEKFDQSMQLFSYTFNRPPTGKTARLNVHKPSQQIDNYCIGLINQQNEYDIQLYAYALQQFKKRYKQMCDELNQLIPKGCDESNTDHLLDLNYKKRAHYKLHTDINYSFSQPLLGSGWHRREITLPENSYFRWTHRDNAFIDFWLEPQDYILRIRIINAIATDHLSLLDIQINNTSIDYKYDQSQGVVKILTAIIPNNLIENNLLRVQFNHPPPLNHDEIFSSKDQRNLGIAVNWIKINPCKIKTSVV